MVLAPTQVTAQLAASKTLYKEMSKATGSLLSGNEAKDFGGMSSENISRLSDGATDISKAISYQVRSESVASNFEKTGNQLNNLQEIVAEMEGALAMGDENTAKNQTLQIVADKLLSSIATTLSTSGRDGKNLFAGTVNANNIRTMNFYDNTNDITSVGYMTDPSADDFVALREGDSTNIALKPEDLKDIIGAAQEIKRLAGLGTAVPASVTNVFNNGGNALNSMISSVKTTYDKASQSVEYQTETIGSVRDNLQHHMGVDEGAMAQALSDLQNMAKLLQSIEMMKNSFEAQLANFAMRG